MDNPLSLRHAANLLVYPLLAAMIMLLKLLPFSNGAAGVPVPDFLVLLTVVWVLRRPETIPPVSVALVFFLSEILFFQPLGLWSAIMVILTEFLRRREGAWREAPFPAEWALASAAIAFATLIYAASLAIFAVDQPSLGLTLLRLLLTVAFYPFAVALARLAGLRKSLPGEADRGRVSA